jgi:cellulose synthase/poly-beta-1,6-N-acetylglucosamine synthase-like glycosyltransferase
VRKVFQQRSRWCKGQMQVRLSYYFTLLHIQFFVILSNTDTVEGLPAALKVVQGTDAGKVAFRVFNSMFRNSSLHASCRSIAAPTVVTGTDAWGGLSLASS